MRAEDRAADDDEEPRDDLAPARGILFVLMLALLFWGILAWLVWLL